MAGSRMIGEERVILGPRILISDQNQNRVTCGASLMDAGEQLRLIGFRSPRGIPPSWSASLKVSGKLGFIDGRAGRHPFDQGTHSRTVGFPEQGGAKGGAHGHVHGLNPACILMKMCRCSGIASVVCPPNADGWRCASESMVGWM